MEGYESVTLVPHSDLEKSVEELQRNSSVNHGLVTEQDVEQKSKELRMLGETLTELKSKCGRDLECVSGDYCDCSRVAFHHIASLMQPLKALPVCLSAFTLKLPSISGQLFSKCSNPYSVSHPAVYNCCSLITHKHVSFKTIGECFYEQTLCGGNQSWSLFLVCTIELHCSCIYNTFTLLPLVT